MAINKYGDHGIRWISHGMLRIEISRMKQLFQYPLNKITEVGHTFYLYFDQVLTYRVDHMFWATH